MDEPHCGEWQEQRGRAEVQMYIGRVRSGQRQKQCELLVMNIAFGRPAKLGGNALQRAESNGAICYLLYTKPAAFVEAE